MNDSKFYICRTCGNIIGMVEASGVIPECCGTEMENLVPNTVEASREKHLPVVTLEGDNLKVCVGSAVHPMTAEHHISWIYLETETGGQRRALAVGGAPEAVFALAGARPVAVYAYCNLHGLWKTEIK